jgi:8-oxo-dGTP pyrophosphatase MutT (NUDIX family)
LRLQDLLREDKETDAAAEAKKKGYKSDGFGRWKDSETGDVVARTDHTTGKLVPVDNDDLSTGLQAKPDTPAKPTGMSAKDAGTAIKSTPGKSDIQKMNGMSQSPSKPQQSPMGDPQQQQQTPTVKANPHLNQLKLNLGKSAKATHEQVKKYFELKHVPDPDHLLDEYVACEEPILVNKDVLINFMYPKTDENPQLHAIEDAGFRDAERQNQEWRSQLSLETQKTLASAINLWKSNVRPKFDDEQFQKLQKVINDICQINPPTVQLKTPLERGLILRPQFLTDFLKRFRVGEEIDLDASGFSISPSIARDLTTHQANEVGILLRLVPNREGTLYGLHITMDKSEYSSKIDYHHMREQEVIRYKGPKVKCIGMKKLLTIFNKTVFCLYVIDLEEEGYPKQIAEGFMHPIQRSLKALTEYEPLDEQEGEAAEQAHKLGLVSIGGAYWADQSGNIVAQTVNDKLVKFTGKEVAGMEHYADNDGNIHYPKVFQEPKAELPQKSGKQWLDDKGSLQFSNKSDLSGKILNGIHLDEPWTNAPTETKGWLTQIKDLIKPNLETPEWPQSNKKRTAGAIVVEPDGRVWTVEPTNHYAGYEHTFPKGTIDDEFLPYKLNDQITAVKEVYEESGLKIEITGYFGDFERDGSIARYFFAKRVGGSPATHGWETQAVDLVPLKELEGHVNNPVDKKISKALVDHIMKYGTITTPQQKPEKKKVPTNEIDSVGNIMHKRVGHASGTNPGGVFLGADGVKRYVKQYADPTQSQCEALACDIYHGLGIGVPEPHQIWDGENCWFASDWIDGEELANVKNKNDLDTAAIEILHGFAADVLLANWDVIGVNEGFMRNILLSNTTTAGVAPVNRIDNGGALLFRGLNGRKKEHVLNSIPELQGFFDFSTNSSYAQIAKEANVNKVEDFAFSFISQVRDIRALEKREKGWDAIVNKICPKMAPNDKQQVITMLQNRSKLLYQKAFELQIQSRNI